VSTIEHLLQESCFEGETFERLQLSTPVCDKEFTGCSFLGLKAETSIWKGVRFEDCTFGNGELTRAQFLHARFIDVTFRGCKLMGIDWSSVAANPTLTFDTCDLRYASFVKVNLRKTVFRGCRACEANFIDCALIESDFSDTDLTGANFDGSDLGKANLATATGAFLVPGKNRVKDTRISLETAVWLAQAQGMKVAGYGDASTRSRRR